MRIVLKTIWTYCWDNAHNLCGMSASCKHNYMLVIYKIRTCQRNNEERKRLQIHQELDDNQQENVFSNNCILKIKSLCDALAIINLKEEGMGKVGLNNLSQWFVSLRIAGIAREILASCSKVAHNHNHC